MPLLKTALLARCRPAQRWRPTLVRRPQCDRCHGTGPVFVLPDDREVDPALWERLCGSCLDLRLGLRSPGGRAR